MFDSHANERRTHLSSFSINKRNECLRKIIYKIHFFLFFLFKTVILFKYLNA